MRARPAAIAVKSLLTCLALFALCSLAGAQDPKEPVVSGEFPGLQLLPPGSEIKGISLPRYEKHRVTTLLRAGALRVLSRTQAELTDIDLCLYAEDGTQLHVFTPGAVYDFTTLRAATKGEVRVEEPRFSAQGKNVVFNTELKRGMLVGPVRTTISASVFGKGEQALKAKKEPAAQAEKP